MKVYAKVMSNSTIQNNYVEHDLGIMIVHEGKTYTISEDNSGHLILKSVDHTQLILSPGAANSIKVDSK